MVLLCGCRTPTQITLELTTDAVCADVDTTSVSVAKADEVETPEPQTVTGRCQDGRIGSLVLVPSGNENASIAIRVVMGVGKSAEACERDDYIALAGEQAGCIVARRRLRFVPETRLTLPIEMNLDCLNLPCGTAQTCARARCVSAEIEDARACASAEGCALGGADAGDAPGTCPVGLPGPVLVSVPAPAGNPVSSYCMDATEVTNADYAAFLAAKGTDPSGQDTWCSWNTSYTPPGWPRPGRDDYPVGYVDWCDAYAYCAWADKHLCGKVGGGANPFEDAVDATKSEWFNACSAGGSLIYPYGNAYDGAKCVGPDYDGVVGYQSGSDGPRAAGTATCEGGYPGLHDLSGNLWEWENTCNAMTGASDACALRGGSFYGVSTDLKCRDVYPNPRNVNGAADVGFRCCSAVR